MSNAEELAGRVLDATLYLKLFPGREIRPSKVLKGDFCHVDDGTFTPAYSANIPYAWQVVEEMHRRGDFLSLDYDPEDFSRLRWVARFRVADVWASADTPAEAICRAALKALQVDEDA